MVECPPPRFCNVHGSRSTRSGMCSAGFARVLASRGHAYPLVLRCWRRLTMTGVKTTLPTSTCGVPPLSVPTRKASHTETSAASHTLLLVRTCLQQARAKSQARRGSSREFDFCQDHERAWGVSETVCDKRTRVAAGAIVE